MIAFILQMIGDYHEGEVKCFLIVLGKRSRRKKEATQESCLKGILKERRKEIECVVFTIKNLRHTCYTEMLRLQ